MGRPSGPEKPSVQAKRPAVTAVSPCHSNAQEGPGSPRECVCHGPWPQGALTIDTAGG